MVFTHLLYHYAQIVVSHFEHNRQSLAQIYCFLIWKPVGASLQYREKAKINPSCIQQRPYGISLMNCHCWLSHYKISSEKSQQRRTHSLEAILSNW